MDARYPVGKYEEPKNSTAAMRKQAIDEIAAAPANLRAAVKGLGDAQLDTPYRDGGWTVRQVVHHIADSHLNAYIRLRLALTENEPTIKPYEEGLWANLPDAKSAPPEISLTLLEPLHDRFVRLWRTLGDADYAKTFRHPEHGVRSLGWLLFLYAWHGKHHTAHITQLRQQKGW